MYVHFILINCQQNIQLNIPFEVFLIKLHVYRFLEIFDIYPVENSLGNRKFHDIRLIKKS